MSLYFTQDNDDELKNIINLHWKAKVQKKITHI